MCQLCLQVRNRNIVEDEVHVVFECLSYECVRNKYRDLFIEQTTVTSVNLNTKKQSNSASFLMKLPYYGILRLLLSRSYSRG